MKTKCPACGSKQTGVWKPPLMQCFACGGRWDPARMDEGGTHDDYRADERLIREEMGGPIGYAIRQSRELRGGLVR